MGIRSILLLSLFRFLSVDGQNSEDNLPDDFLLIMDANIQKIYLMDINTSSFFQIPPQDYPFIYAFDIDYDPTAAVIFWTEISQIYSLTISGNNQNTVLSLADDSFINGIAVDSISRLLFYTDYRYKIIAVINLENYSQKKVIHRDVIYPGDIVTDPVHGIIYWIDYDTILKSKYDGTNVNVVLESTIYIFDLDVDINAGVLYWCEWFPDIEGTVDISRGNLNDSDLRSIHHEAGRGCSLALYHSYLYFTNYSGVRRISTDGTELMPLASSENWLPIVIHVHINANRVTNGCSKGRGNCSHFCFPLADGSKMCACPDLMKLKPDNLTCQYYVLDDFLLFTANGYPLANPSANPSAIYLMDLNNNNYSLITIQHLHIPYAITYNQINKTIYWTDRDQHQISSASMLYAGRAKVILQLGEDTSPRGISVDAMSGILFYTDLTNGIIAAVSLDGSMQKVVISNSLDQPYAIVTDPINGVIYWTSLGKDGMIAKANYDGTNKEELINTGSVNPDGLAIDFQAGVLYWCMSSVIMTANVNGSNKNRIFHDENADFSSIAIYKSYLYYTDRIKGSVMRIGIDGGNRISLDPDGQFVDIHVNTIGSVSIGTNGCSYKSHGCSHFCFPRPGDFKVCACPNGMNLQPDNHTCIENNTLPTECPGNATIAPPGSSCQVCGSSEELIALHATVGSLAGLLVICVLTIFWLIRNNRRMGVKNKDMSLNTNSMATVDENDDYHTIPAAINTDIRNEPEAFFSISTNTALYRSQSDEQEGNMSPNNSGGNFAIDYIHCI